MLNISESGFHAGKARPLSDRELKNKRLEGETLAIKTQAYSMRKSLFKEKMDKKEILVTLIATLEDNQELLRSSISSEEKRILLISMIEDSCEAYDEITVTNANTLLKHYLIDENLDIDKVIFHMKEWHHGQLISQANYREIEDKFDQKYGTLTAIVKHQYDLQEVVSIERLINSEMYHPTPVKTMYLALESLSVDYSDYTFIDIGSGIGRNLLIASEYSFQRIIGLEISSYLHKIAEKNIYIYKNKSTTQKSKNIFSHCIDVLDFEFIGESFILYFWHPFSNEIFDKLFLRILNVLEIRNKEIILIFLDNVYPIVKSSKKFRLINTIQTEDKLTHSDYSYIYTWASTEFVNNA